MKMMLEVLVTTMNGNIIDLIRDFYPQAGNVIFQISHQITENSENIYISEVKTFLQERPDVSYYSYFEKGLSQNRNRSMEHSKGDIVLVTDDDIVFKAEAFTTVIKAFLEVKEAVIITFKTEFPDGIKYKNYKSKIFKHTKRSCMRISSFEIAYRRKSIEKAGLKWDERFGLGGDPYTNHMENIFMVDALRMGLNCYFFPKTIVIHPFMNSGFDYNDQLVFSKGAAFARMFGRWAYVLNLLYAIKKYLAYRKQLGFWKFLIISNKGSKNYLDLYGTN